MRRRRNTDPVLLLAVVAALAAGGAIAAAVMHQRNEARLAAYRTNPPCGGDLSPQAARSAANSGVCSIERATVVSRWVHTYRSSRYYRLAIRSADNVVDSLELTGDRSRDVWQGAVPDGLVFVERFTDPDPAAKRHVTMVREGGIVAGTEWNPERRGDQAMVGVVFLGVLAPAFGIGALVTRRKRRPAM